MDLFIYDIHRQLELRTFASFGNYLYQRSQLLQAREVSTTDSVKPHKLHSFL